MRKIGFTLLFVCLLGLPASAGIVTRVDDPLSSDALQIGGGQISGQVLAVTWNQPALSGVAISVNLQPTLFSTDGAFDAYLMDSIGNQIDTTFYSDQLAHTQFSLPDTQQWVTLWNGLTLDAGQMFLVIGTSSDNSGGWTSTLSPTITNGLGFAGDGLGNFQFFAYGSDVNATYLPASNFAIDDLSSGTLLYDVSVPEPSPVLLVGVVLLPLGLLARRRRAACR